MANIIKGLTVEIGGDTTKLGKALEDVDKKSRSLSSELGDINRLLKMDPGNTDLLAQKQKVLADAISNTGEKLAKLKEAEKQVQEQFEKGEVSEEQVRALQREIIATEKKMGSYEKAAKETEQALKGVGDESKEVTEKSGKLGAALGNAAKVGLQAVAAAATAAVGGLIAAAESTREYRTEMGKLDTAFTMTGHSSEAAQETYKTLQGVLGETDQAVEASNHLAQLCEDEEQLATMTEAMTGVYAMFGASLPLEGLAEAANESAKTGQVTGSLADALNWASVSSKRWSGIMEENSAAQAAFNKAIEEGANTEDAFNAALAACSSEQERAALITDALSGAYQEEAWAFQDANAEVIRANQANEAWMASMADVGGAIEPIITDVKSMGAALLSDLVPGVQQLAGSFRELLNGDTGAAAGVGEALSGIITQLLTKATELAPTLAQAAISLVTSLTTTLITMLPQIITTGVEILMALIQGITQAIPQVTQAIVNMIPQLVQALVTGIPQLIQGAVQLLLAIVQAIPQIVPPLVAALPTIVLSIIDGLVQAIPQLLNGAVQFLTAIIEAIPLIIHALIPQVPTIVTAVIEGLISCLPSLLNGAVQLLNAIIKAIPIIIRALVPQIPSIVNTIIDTLLNNLPILLDAAVELFMALVKAIPQVVGALARELPTVVNTVMKVLGTLGTKVLGIGKDLVTGLWNGIKNKLSWLKEKISGFASSVLGSIKSFFGVNSPSKETAWIGEMLDEGLAKGVDDAANDPIKAMRRVSSGVLDAASGMGGIGFERQLHNTGSTAAVAAGGLGDTSALLAKLDGIYERLGRLQVVLDTGTLVGETIEKIDNSLATRQLLSARGV